MCQFDKLTKKWKVIILKEEETVRKGRKKYTWEFILKKNDKNTYLICRFILK